MKKLHVARVVDSYHGVAGTYHSARRFTQELARRGHKMFVLTARMEGAPAVAAQNIKYFYFRGVPVPRWQKRMYMALPRTHELLDVFKNEQIDVVHLDNINILGWKAIKAARRLGIPVVTTAHTHSGHIMPHLRPFDFGIVKNVIDRYHVTLFNMCDHVIAPSEYTEGHLKANGVRVPITVISNGVPVDEFKPRKTKRPAKLADKKVVLSVSRLHPEKRVDDIIRAISYVDAHLLVVGWGSDEERLRNLVKQLRLENKVTFTGAVPDKELPKYFNFADVFVSASECENEGMSVLEAMASGLPIAVCDSPTNAASSFVKGNGFVFRTGDPKDLAERLRDLFSKSNAGKKSLELVSNYSLKRSADRVETLYYRLTKVRS